jgi:hypothetical protein
MGISVLLARLEDFTKVIPNFWLMADVHDKATRSYNMSRVKRKDAQPEMLVSCILFLHDIHDRLKSIAIKH